MIEDIDGTTSEPRRRGHVAALSAAIASAALVLLVALVVLPPRVEAPTPAAPPALSLSTALMQTVVANPTAQRLVDLTRATDCADGSRLIPPYNLAFEASSGHVLAEQAGRSFPLVFVADARTGRLIVMCVTSGLVAPRLDRAR